MKKERILDILFWLGFFMTLILLFLGNKFFLLGVLIVILTMILNFSLKTFIKKDIFVVGYYIGAILSIASINKINTLSFIIGIILMLFSIIAHKLLLQKVEIREHHKKVVEKVHNIESKSKKHLTIIPKLLSLFAIAILIFSLIKLNLIYLILGLVVSLFAVIIIIIDLKQAVTEATKKENKLSKSDINISAMKNYIALNHEKYETDIDKLYKLVEKFKKIKLSQIKKIFNISDEKAEEWAKILESHELAELHYPALGEPELKWKQ